MNTKFVPTMSSPADAARLLFVGLVGLLLTAEPTSGLTVTWGADTPDSVELPQCEDLTFEYSGTNSIMQFQTKDKFERCDFNRSLTMLSTKNNGVYTITGSSMGHKRGKEYFGSDFLDLCDRQNMKMQVEIIPSFTAHMDTTCMPVEGRRPISRVDVGSISRCEKACVKKDECLGFEFNPGASNDCMLFDYVPEPLFNMTTSAPTAGPTSMPVAAGNETSAPTASPSSMPVAGSDNTCVPAGGMCEFDDAGDPISLCCATGDICVTSTCVAAPSTCVSPGGICEVDDAGDPISECCSPDNACVDSRCIATDPPTMMPTGMPTASPSSMPTPGPTRIPTASPTTGMPTMMPSSCVAAGSSCTLDEDGNPIEPCCSEGHVCMMIGSGTRCVTSDPPTMMPTMMPTPQPTPAPTPRPSLAPITPFPSLSPTPAPSAEPTSAPTGSPSPGPTMMPSSVCVAAGSACTLGEDGNPIEPCCSEEHECIMIGSSTRCVTPDPATPPPVPPPTSLVQPLEQGTTTTTVPPGAVRNLRVRRPINRALQQESIPGAACYAGLSACPEPPAPHCSIDTEVTCAVANNTSVECDDAASLLPSNVTAGDEACNIRLVYTTRAIIQTRTFYPDISKTTYAMRTRKGGEPVSFARPREYDWLENEKILDVIPGAGTLPFMSEEEVIVDFCSKETYKTLAEFVVNTQPKTICTGRDQYKLDVAGLSSV